MGDWKSDFLKFVIIFIANSTLAIGFLFNDLFPTEKCYHPLGCFSINGNFRDLKNRPFQLLPQNRATVGTRFFLYTRHSPNDWRELKTNDSLLLRNSGYRHGKPLKIIVHGFIQSGFVPWIQEMRRAILATEDSNVIQVDWRSGAEIPYEQATANTRLVGAEISHLICFLKRQTTNFKFSAVHLIGHSLGAHICGYAGKYFKFVKLGRISALDPAGPAFEGTKPIIRVDRNDADFVTVIHTNVREKGQTVGLGMSEAVGHADIYLNGGVQQPGCSVLNSINSLFNNRLGEAVACSHQRAISFFTATVQQSPGCNFTAFRCSSYKSFEAGNCFDCSRDGSCISVGYRTSKLSAVAIKKVNKYFMKTTGSSPYCGYHSFVNLSFSPQSEQLIVRFKIQFQNNQNVQYIPAENQWMTVVPGKSSGSIVLTESTLSDQNELNLSWRRKGIERLSHEHGTRNSNLKVLKITIHQHSNRSSRRFCSNATLTERSTHRFSLC